MICEISSISILRVVLALLIFAPTHARPEVSLLWWILCQLMHTYIITMEGFTPTSTKASKNQGLEYIAQAQSWSRIPFRCCCSNMLWYLLWIVHKVPANSLVVVLKISWRQVDISGIVLSRYLWSPSSMLSSHLWGLCSRCCSLWDNSHGKLPDIAFRGHVKWLTNAVMG